MATPSVRSGSTSSKGSLTSDQPLGFFSRLLSILGLEPDPDREKKARLKELKNALKKAKWRFFIPSGDQADVGLAKTFYEMYSVVGPAKALLSNASSSNALRGIFIDQVLTEHQRNLRDQISEDAIRTAAKTVAPEVLAGQIREALVEFAAAFDAERQKIVDGRYNLFLAFMDFIEFNYYFMLKKFDSMLPDNDFNYLPRWEAIDGEYVADDLKDFLTATGGMLVDSDWDGLFDVLKLYKQIDVVSRPNWKKMMGNLMAMKRSGVLLQMAQYLSKDPSYQPKVYMPSERIVEPFLDGLRSTAETVLAHISHERKLDKVNTLVTQVFGTTGISRTKNYTEKANLVFQKKKVGGYTLVEPMNYLKAFLLDYYKRDIRELVNLLLVKGQWVTNALAAPLSESFHQLMEVSDRITMFDELLAEDAERGAKLKTLLMRADKDSNAANSIKIQLKDINSGARSLIVEAATHLVVIGKHLKMAIDDLAKPKHELILNWKMLEQSTDKGLKDWQVATYKQLYAFVQLMQFFVKEQPAG